MNEEVEEWRIKKPRSRRMKNKEAKNEEAQEAKNEELQELKNSKNPKNHTRTTSNTS